MYISGQDLSDCLQAGYLARIFPAKVAPSPGNAIARISEAFGVTPSGSGRNIPAIEQLRKEINDFSVGCAELQAIGNSLMICAPHTHWDPNRPIILSREGNTYRSGPMKLEPKGQYVPISFVFTGSGPVAFEWGDVSLGISPEDYKAIWCVISAVNDAVWSYDWPLGLSLNFRFKGLFEDSYEPTVEYSDDDNDEVDMARIYTVDDLYRERGQVDFVQVGWHAHADDSYSLSSEASEALARVRQNLERLSLSERINLEQVLKEKFSL